MGSDIKYAIENEAWNVYSLKDGSTLKVRIVLTAITRTGVNPYGEPIYRLEHAIVTHVEAYTDSEHQDEKS
jgi:hypothetical protein